MRTLTLLVPLLAVGCLNRPTLVSITPDHGYEDGCIAVELQGHHLGTKASAKVGGTEVIDLAPAEDAKGTPPQATDVGFKYTGIVPPGAKGWADVEMTIDGEKKVIEDGFYYEACPASVHADYVAVPDPATVGDVLTIYGCGLSDSVSVDFYAFTGTTTTGTGPAPLPVANVPVVPTAPCNGTAEVTAEVPAGLADGTYTVHLVHDDGTVWSGYCYHDSGDTGETCDPVFVTVGGAK